MMGIRLVDNVLVLVKQSAGIGLEGLRLLGPGFGRSKLQLDALPLRDDSLGLLLVWHYDLHVAVDGTRGCAAYSTRGANQQAAMDSLMDGTRSDGAVAACHEPRWRGEDGREAPPVR